MTLGAVCNNTRVLSEFNSTDVTYEVFWTMNSSYLSANGYNATIVVDNFKATMLEKQHIRVGLLSGLHPMQWASHPPSRGASKGNMHLSCSCLHPCGL